MTILQILLIISKIIIVCCIWPPPYKIDLRQSEEFTIGDYTDKAEDVEEIIQDIDLNKDKDKFNLLHKQVKKYNSKINQNLYKRDNIVNTYAEEYYNEEEQPFESGFNDNTHNLVLNSENNHVYYFNQTTKQLVAREIINKQSEDDYDYEKLYKEYNLQIKENGTLLSNITEAKENVKEALHKMIDFKEPKNCTAEELRGIGFGAIKCALKDIKESETTEKRIEVFYRIKRIIIIWLWIYIAIVIPSWCHKGWCCCCFQCKFCKPRELIDEAKKYYAENKPGIYIKTDGEIITYQPSIYETDAYLKLEDVLMKL